MANNLTVRTCPNCGEEKLARGRGVMMNDEEVCDVCSLPGTRQKVEALARKVCQLLVEWSEFDLSSAQKHLDDAEGNIADAEESLPGDWQAVAGCCAHARREIDRAYDIARETIIQLACEAAKANLQKAGHVQSTKTDPEERAKDQVDLDAKRAGVERALRTADGSFTDYKDQAIDYRDRMSLLRQGLRQARRAYYRSQVYLGKRDEASVERVLTTIEESEAEHEEVAAAEVAAEDPAVEVDEELGEGDVVEE